MFCAISLKTHSFIYKPLNSEWRLTNDKTLKAFSQLWLAVAITSQCVIGYCAANYYNYMDTNIHHLSINSSLTIPTSIKSKIIHIIYR